MEVIHICHDIALWDRKPAVSFFEGGILHYVGRNFPFAKREQRDSVVAELSLMVIVQRLPRSVMTAAKQVACS